MSAAPRLVLAALAGFGLAALSWAAVGDIPVADTSEATLTVDQMPPPTAVKGYLQLGFDRLAGYEFVFHEQPADRKVPRWTGQDEIPDVVKSWNGKKAEIRGFMVPTKLEKGLVTECLLLRDQSTCCYGAAPSMNHFVVVSLAKGVPPVADKVVRISGTFQVGTSFDAFGFMTGIYRMAGEKVVEVEE